MLIKMKLKSFVLFCLLAQTVFAQIEFSLQLDKFGVTYTVFAKPIDGATISSKIMTSTAQVTLITPNGLELAHFKDLGGEWDGGTSIVRAPEEDPAHDYISIGFVGDRNPALKLKSGKPIALFAFETLDGCQGPIRLIDNRTDVFAKIPNSANNNPGNDISAIDIGGGMARLFYKGNYEPFIAECPNNQLSPFSTALEGHTEIYETLQLEREDGAESYSVQARIKGAEGWLAEVPFKGTKLYFYGHLEQIYEYRVKTIFKDGLEEWSDISEISRVEIESDSKYLKP